MRPFLYQHIYLLLCERKLRVGLIAPEDATACGSVQVYYSSTVLGPRTISGQRLTDLGRIRSRRYTKLFYPVQVMRQAPLQRGRKAADPRLCPWLLAAGSEYDQREIQTCMVDVAQPIHSSRSKRRDAIGTLLEKP